MGGAYNGNGQKKKSGLDKLFFAHLIKDGDISIYHLLRKPDFQRETNEWDKKRIADLISSFIDRAFIPAVILWENEETGLIYVIDGAHRLSAILSYINNDYGYGKISHDFNRYTGIPEAERALAQETEDHINKTIGSYEEIKAKGGTKINGLKTAYFDVQMITGDSEKAADSFFKINQQGVVLSPTEKALCKGRELPSCLATRSILKGASGHQYWAKFEASIQKKVKDISQELNKMLFEPPYMEDTLSIVLHNPLGGPITNGMPMVYELMKLVKGKYKTVEEKSDITSGSETLEYLEWTRKIIWKTLSENPGSLGLHPSIYFYNSGGKYIHSAFLGLMEVLIDNDGQKEASFLSNFTRVRANIERFLINFKMFLGQINAKYGSRERSHRHLKGFFLNLIKLFEQHVDLNYSNAEPLVLERLKDIYVFLNERDSDIEKRNSKRFTGELKTFMRIKDELERTARCAICGGFLHPFSIDYDHKQDKKFGGNSSIENGQATHVYCNNSKDKLISLGIYNPNN